MQLLEIDNAQVHDLLQIDPDSLIPDGVDAAPWVRRTLNSCPWAVVRRARVPAGQIAIGIRGTTRSERWGGFIRRDQTRHIVRPAEVLTYAGSSLGAARTPSLSTLQEVIEMWRDLTLPWGPIGSVGFELATGPEVTNDLSDLDIAIRAPGQISVAQARSLWERVARLQVRVDVCVETPECGFSLDEYACSPSARIMLRYPEGSRLGDDPWSTQAKSVGNAL